MLVVIDALRVDFVQGPGAYSWPHLKALNLDQKVHCEVSHLQAPSVTLPRIKAMTTGTVPKFSDLLLNFDGGRVSTDSWLVRLKENNWSLKLFGDETWLKLYPKIFDEVDPVSSLFVTDFDEVDHNVTRHLDKVLPMQRSNSLFLLHYLGLDHIGHVEGPRGITVERKLKEMDDVIGRLAASFPKDDDDWLIVVTGDHGMSDKLGHGGSSPQELFTPSIYISPRFRVPSNWSAGPNLQFGCHMEQVWPISQQLDLDALMSHLTGLGRSAQSLAIISPQLLRAFHRDDLEFAEATAHLLLRFKYVLKCYEPTCFALTHQLGVKAMFEAEKKLDMAIKACHKKSECSEVVAAAIRVFHALRPVQLAAIQQANHFSLKTMLVSSGVMWALLTILLISFARYIVKKLGSTLPSSKGQWSSTGAVESLFKFALFALVTHSFSLLATSFVEEEHQTWYYLSSTLLLLSVGPLLAWHHHHDFPLRTLALMDCVNPLLIVICDRGLRRLHQTGDKWINTPDLSDWLYKMENREQLWLVLCVAWSVIFLLRCWSIAWSRLKTKRIGVAAGRCRKWLPALTILMVLTSQAFYRWEQLSKSGVQKGSRLEEVWLARVAYACIGLDLFVCVSHWLRQLPICVSATESKAGFLQPAKSAEPLSQALALYVCLVGRPCLTLLWAITLLKEAFMQAHWRRVAARLPQMEQTTLRLVMCATYWMQGWVTFYQMGTSHQIASVDFSVALVGFTQFHYYACGALLALYMFAGPLFWHLAYQTRVTTVFPGRQSAQDSLQRHQFVYVVAILPICVFSTVCVAMRHHLFVWSVFAPKCVMLGVTLLFLTPVLFLSFLHNG